MFTQFGEAAERTVMFAQEEAWKLGEHYVATEHLLLGLVREKDNRAAKVLTSMGVSLKQVRSEVRSRVEPKKRARDRRVELASDAKLAIDLTYEEARSLNKDIWPEHLLLGLIRESEGLAGKVLADLGVRLDQARAEACALPPITGS